MDKVLERHWHVVGLARDLAAPGSVMGATILGQDVVGVALRRPARSLGRYLRPSRCTPLTWHRHWRPAQVQLPRVGVFGRGQVCQDPGTP